MTVGNDRAAHPTAFTVSLPMGDVAVRVAGQRASNRPALLLLHANPGDSRDFNAVIPALAREFTVVTVDWPGYGRSTANHPSRVTVKGLVTVMEQVIDALDTRGISRLAIIGNSVGGYVSVRLAQRRESAIAGLILVDPGGFTPQNAIVRAFCRHVMGSPAIARWLIVPLARTYLGRLRTPSARATYSRARQVRHRGQRLEVHCALWRSFADPYFDLTNISPPLAVPTLLIWGRRDPILLAVIDGRRARRALPMPLPCCCPPDTNLSMRDPRRFSVMWCLSFGNTPVPIKGTAMRSAEAGRRALLDAGHRLLAESDLARLAHDRLADAMEPGIDHLCPELDRIAAGMTTYLDGCLRSPATKALLVQARTDAELGPHVAARNNDFARMATADLDALGWEPAEPIAALLVAAVAEIALHEVAAGHRRDDLRNAALALAAHDPTAQRRT